MKQTDEYKLCSLEEAEAFAQKRADYIKHLEEGLESSLALNKAQAEKISNMEIWEKKYLDRIAELEKGGEVAGRFYWESVVDGHVMAVPSEGTPHYNKDDFPLYTAPRELSDEEIRYIWQDCKGQVNDLVIFARAILKKASEK